MRLFLAISLSFTVAACGNSNQTEAAASFKYVGDVGAPMVTYINKMPSNSRLTITSFGGDPEFGLKVAKLIVKKKISISVRTACMSACADFIIPAGTSVTLIDNALVGFHGNDFIYSQLAAQHGVTDYCSLKRLPYLRAIYKAKNLNEQFYLSTMDHLNIIGYDAPSLNKCDATLHEDVNMWFPTSAQLREQWGLQFTGRTCSDTEQCVTDAVKYAFKRPGLKIAFGDKILTTGK